MHGNEKHCKSFLAAMGAVSFAASPQKSDPLGHTDKKEKRVRWRRTKERWELINRSGPFCSEFISQSRQPNGSDLKICNFPLRLVEQQVIGTITGALQMERGCLGTERNIHILHRGFGLYQTMLGPP